MNYKKIVTKDGSETIYNSNFDETYHSISGAFEEALEKYVKPLQIVPHSKILDFCFGLGYNSIATLINHNFIEITALEIDPEIVNKMGEIEVPQDDASLFKLFSHLPEKQSISYRESKIELIVGDARKTIKSLQTNYFDNIFFDPFSPKKQPEMWETKVFIDIYKILKNGGRLATYSCAKQIRRNMQEAGFDIKDGPAIGRKSPSTIATKSINNYSSL
ncbi:MAG: MnmC family methyltransferase [Candidatus Cloacimonadota bacterium]|nr:MnmC family methyltransferase [Candidatus Cloacimonadota bacterium]